MQQSVRKWLLALLRSLSPRYTIQLIISRITALVVLFALYGSYKTAKALLRKLVFAVKEILARVTGDKRHQRLRFLKKTLTSARSYGEWSMAAKEIDYLQGRSVWRDEVASDDYAFSRIQLNSAVLEEMLDAGKAEAVMNFLRSRLLRNLGGIGNKKLHTHLRCGTKANIERYIEEVSRGLHFIAEEPEIPSLKKLAFFNETRHAFGRSALLFSGGATFGLYHSGVIQALDEEGLLPRIFSGSSVGAIFAGIVGTRTDDELKDLYDVDKVDLSFFPSTKGSALRKLQRFFRMGVLMDMKILENCIRSNIGEYTFAEAYARTGRVINVVVAPLNIEGENARLLNYLTAPDVMIFSAVCASCAIPGIYQPVELLRKNSKGKIVKYYSETVLFIDGSFSLDLPMQRLSELFNVNHYIVSQVNPFVIPFVFPKVQYKYRYRVVENLMKYLTEDLRSILHNVCWFQ